MNNLSNILFKITLTINIIIIGYIICNSYVYFSEYIPIQAKIVNISNDKINPTIKYKYKVNNHTYITKQKKFFNVNIHKNDKKTIRISKLNNMKVFNIYQLKIILFITIIMTIFNILFGIITYKMTMYEKK